MIEVNDELMYVLLGITGVLFLIQIIYLTGVYNIVARNRKKSCEVSEDNLPPLSVIIVAKDSLEDLKNNLPLILEQDYPSFEVIVIYEQEEDIYEDELKLLQEKYKNLYHTFIPDSARYISHKKLGITMGIKASKNDILVFTEPNAYPTSNQWLKTISSHFTEETDIVLGYSNYEKIKGWFNRKIVFDKLINNMRGLGMAINGYPFTGSGYNLAYRKKLYYDNGGFSRHLNLERGEDDLFINQQAKQDNTKVMTSAEGTVRITHPVNKYMWREEKLSNIITKRYYKGINKYIVGFESFTRLLFLFFTIVVGIISIILKSWIYLGIAVILWIIRYIVQIVIFKKTCDNFNERHYYLSLMIFDIIQPIINLNFYIRKKLSNKKDFLKK